MKNLCIILSMAFTGLLMSNARAQEGSLISDLYLKGRWKAECPEEIMSKAGFRHCELCPFVVVSEKGNKAMIKDIELDFQADSLTLNQLGTSTTVAYARNKENHSIRFRHKGKTYKFRVFLHGNERILVGEKDELILVLTKAD